MIIYLGIALVLSFTVVKIMLRLKAPCALSVVIGIVCFLILVGVGVFLIKGMDTPPAGLNHHHTGRFEESSRIMKNG